MSFYTFVHYYRLIGRCAVAMLAVAFLIHAFSTRAMDNVLVGATTTVTTSSTVSVPIPVSLPPLDKQAYDAKMLELANNDTTGKWPVKNVSYPLDGALLPMKRIVAFYGNFYSKQMGILGQYSPDTVLSKLSSVVSEWEKADPGTPVVPAIHYIAVVAQGYPGKDKTYISRMPFTEIDKAIALADQAHAVVFLDIQTGNSTVAREVPLLEKYLKMPNVHLGIDPEFSMENGKKPGTVIGSLDASDINTASAYLAKLVQENNLPPKILVVHRFTGPMVTHYKNIKTRPEVQIVMDMDGWGTVEHKKATYIQVIKTQPVQFTGFKLFYKNDTTRSKSRLMTPAEVLGQTPKPSYIQYQ